jgi:sugar/nucleoside kinase (ribokinase family)
MTEIYDVLVVGDATVDLIFTDLPHLPRLGEDTLAKKFQLIPGEAYNTAVALHRLGIKTAWAANFGNDYLSRIILDFCQAEGLDSSFFVHHNKSFQRLSVAASLPEERGFLSYYDPDPAMPAAIPALAKIHTRMLFVPGLFYGRMFELVLPVIHMKNIKIVMDGNNSEPVTLTDSALQMALKNVSMFLPNRREILRMTGQDDLETAMKMVAEFCPLVIVKDGAGGSYAYDGTRLYHQPSIPVDVVDTTGAGDCFNAGFLKAWLEHKPMDICLQWGNISAGLSTQGFGAGGVKVVTAMIEEYWRKYYEGKLSEIS